MQRYDLLFLLFLSNLGIHASIHSLLTGTPREEQVDEAAIVGPVQYSSMGIVIRPKFVLHHLQVFFSCIAERARSIVGQLLEIRNKLKLIECRIFTRPSQERSKTTPRQNTTQITNTSKHLFHHVVILHTICVNFRCPSCLRLLSLLRRGLSHPANQTTG